MNHLVTSCTEPLEGATAVISGIELVQMLRKGQMKGANNNKSTFDQFISLAA